MFVVPSCASLRHRGRISLAFVLLATCTRSEQPTTNTDRPTDSTPLFDRRAPSETPDVADEDKPTGHSHAAAVQQLEALGYVSGQVDTESRSGVLVHDRAKAQPGLNFYNSRYTSGATLIDNDGAVLHKWRGAGEPWQHAELLPSGDVLVLEKDKRIVRVDKNSREQWSHEALVHHDLSVDEHGRVWALAREKTRERELHPTAQHRRDLILVFDEAGTLLQTVDILAAFQRSPYHFMLPVVDRRDGNQQNTWHLDPLHTNHIEVVREGHPDPRFVAGHVLLSMRNIDAVLVLDPETGEIPWLMGPGFLKFQHHPVLLPTHNILVFDNGRKRSRVVEFDPVAREIVWAYEPKRGFYSRTRGSNQRLANGNTLITESDKGYVFEVTPEGERVWVFANPEFGDQGERTAVWRMTRFDPAGLEFVSASNREKPPEPDETGPP